MGHSGPNAPSPFLAGIGKGSFLGGRTAIIQRFDGSKWRDVARYHTVHDADVALDQAIGEGEEPGALRIVDTRPSTGTRVLMAIAVIVCLAVAVGIVWLFVGG